METECKKYDVFLSYAAEDRSVVEQCYQLLKSFGLDIFFDNRSIVPGDTYVRKIPSAVKNSQYVIVFLSPLSYRKKWVAMEVNAAQKFNVKVIPVIIGDNSLKTDGNDQGDVPVLYSYIDLQDISKIKLQGFLQNPLQYLPEIQNKNEYRETEARLLEHWAEQLTEQCRQYRKCSEIKSRYFTGTEDWTLSLPIDGEEYPVSAETGLQMKDGVLKAYLKIFSSDAHWHDDLKKTAKRKLLECFSGFLPETTAYGKRSSWEFFTVDLSSLKKTFCNDFTELLNASLGIANRFFISSVQQLQKLDAMISVMLKLKKNLSETLSSVFPDDEWYFSEDEQGNLHYQNIKTGCAYAGNLAVFMTGNSGFFELTAVIRYGTDDVPEAVLQLKSDIFSSDDEIFKNLQENFSDLSEKISRSNDPGIFCMKSFSGVSGDMREILEFAGILEKRITEYFENQESDIFDRLEKSLYGSSVFSFENSIRRIISETKNPDLKKYSAVAWDEKQQVHLVVKHPAIYFNTSDLFPVTLRKKTDGYEISVDIADMPGVSADYADFFRKNFAFKETLSPEISIEALHRKLEESCKKRQNGFFELYNQPVKAFCMAIHEMFRNLGLEEKNKSQDECYAAKCNFSMGVKLLNGLLTAAVVSPCFGLWDMRVRLSGNSDFMRLNDSVKLFLFHHLQHEAEKQNIECEFIRKHGNLTAFDMKLPDDLKHFLPLREGKYRDMGMFCNAVEARIKILLSNMELMQSMFRR